MVNNPDNFTELKRLFDLECQRTTAKLKEQGVLAFKAEEIVLTKLLDGRSSSTVKWIFDKAKGLVEFNSMVRADEIVNFS